MDNYDQLRSIALAKRDAIIDQARADYRRTLRDIADLRRTIEKRKTGRPRPLLQRQPHPAKSSDYRNLTTIQAATRVLEDGKARTIPELVMEVQSRGHRAKHDPRAVGKAINGAFEYHRGRFWQDADGRWSAVVY